MQLVDPGPSTRCRGAGLDIHTELCPDWVDKMLHVSRAVRGGARALVLWKVVCSDVVEGARDGLYMYVPRCAGGLDNQTSPQRYRDSDQRHSSTSPSKSIGSYDPIVHLGLEAKGHQLTQTFRLYLVLWEASTQRLPSHQIHQPPRLKASPPRPGS